VTAFCQDAPRELGDAFHLSLKTFVVNTDTKLRLDGGRGRARQANRLGKEFRRGRGQPFTAGWLLALRRPAQAAGAGVQLLARGVKDDRRGDRLGGETFPVNATVDGKLEFSIYEVACEYAFMRRENYEISEQLRIAIRRYSQL
jgi:hypothetical protein